MKVNMNKIILLTIIFAISYDVAWAQTTAVEIREHTGALSLCPNALLGSITTDSNGLLATAAQTGKTQHTTSGTSGSGAVFTFAGDGSASAVTVLHVTTPGSGYKTGDTITFANAGITGTSIDIVITLQSDDIANGALTCHSGHLEASVSQDPDGALAVAPQTGKTATTSGSGSGAVFSLAGDASATKVTELLVTSPGSGYAVGDTLTFANANIAGTGADIIVTLLEGDVSPGDGRILGLPGLVGSITTDSDGSLAVALQTGKTGTTNGAGTGAVFSFAGDNSGSKVTRIVVTNPGSGYQAGDTITFANADITGTGEDIIITLKDPDIHVGYVRTHIDGRLRDSVGDFKSWDDETKTGYYVPLSISTESISVVASFDGTGHTLVPQISTFSDTSLVTDVNSKLLPVNDGLNVLKLVSSLLGTFEIYLIKPEDQIKVIQSNKRSFEIAYTPAAAGEFTCSAFTGDQTDPVNRDEVKTLSGVVAKSVTTNNIVKKNRFRSVQMTLNGLTPFQEYEIHCYHAAHDVISYTDTSNNALAKTDKASLSGVTITMSDKEGEWVGKTLTVTFTHEKTLSSGKEIYLALYDNFDSEQALTIGVSCADYIIITSSVEGSLSGHTCTKTTFPANGHNQVLKITLGAASTVPATSSGTELVIQLTNTDTHLLFPSNPAAGTKVTLDLEVGDHTRLEQIEGWTTV